MSHMLATYGNVYLKLDGMRIQVDGVLYHIEAKSRLVRYPRSELVVYVYGKHTDEGLELYLDMLENPECSVLNAAIRKWQAANPGKDFFAQE